MSYLIARFQRWHLACLSQSFGGVYLPDDPLMLREIEQAPNTWTILHDGTPIAAGGTLEQWPGRHMAWATLGEESRRHMLTITRAAYQTVRRAKGRVEMTVRENFAAGHRWAALLGFSVETPLLASYGPQGENHVGYVLLNRD